MKKNKYMIEIPTENGPSQFTYTAQNMKEAEKEVRYYLNIPKNVVIKVYRIGFDGNYYYDLKTGRRFSSYYD